MLYYEVKAMRWENVYIFISSTFNDMHAERDYLIKSVFPALSEWCDARKLRLMDIDLRWGVTAADSEAKNTVWACLRNIDECRPFFLCFMGQRRGWIPNTEDISENTYNLFPNLLEKSYAGDASVTEMEILHALIDPLHNGRLRGTKDDSRSGQAVEHAFFYLRDPGYLEKTPHSDLRLIYTNEAERDQETADRELARWLNEEIPNTGRPIYTYTAKWQMNESTPEIALPLCVPTTSPKDSDVWRSAFIGWQKRWASLGVKVDESGEISGAELEKANSYNKAYTRGRLGGFEVGDLPLSEVLTEQLKEAISKRFPEHMTIDEMTPLQKELDQQAQFLRIAGDGFIERTGDFDELNNYIDGDETRPFALTAFAGMGKTSLLAHFIDRYVTDSKNGESLHYRFIGGSDGSVSTERLIRSLLEELKEAGKIKSDIPANSIDMMNKLPDFLEEAGKIGKTIIIIDALNQLESGMGDLYWIPSALPQNVKMIISFKRGEESADEYYRQQEESGGMVLAPVKPFDSEDDRKALVVSYLEQYFKALDEPRIRSLIDSEGAGNPLFLNAALSELRVFGVHNDLTEVIKNRFGTTPVTAFGAILARIESDAAYTKFTPAVALPHLFGWIAHSRYGLRIDELADLSVREKLTDNKTDALDAIYLIMRQLRRFLAKRDGRIDFFYESFKIAATERYTGSHKYARKSRDWHKSLAEYFETLPLTNRHKLMEQAWQYARAEMADKYKNLLYDYCYIEARLREFGVADLISDYTYSEDRAVKLMHDCYTLSQHILAIDPSQLASQLWWRMADFKETYVKRLLKQAIDVKKEDGEVWLRPKKACLLKPGGALVRIIPFTDYGQLNLMPDGMSISFFDRTTKKYIIMDVATGKILKTTSNPVSSYTVSEDNKYISYYKKRDYTTCIFIKDIHTGKERKLKGSDYCKSLSFSPDETIFISTDSDDKNIRLWNTKSRKCIGELSGHSDAVFDAFITSNNRYLVSNSSDKTVKIWDLDALSNTHKIKHDNPDFITMKMLNSKQIIIQGHKSVNTYDIKTAESLKEYKRCKTTGSFFDSSDMESKYLVDYVSDADYESDQILLSDRYSAEIHTLSGNKLSSDVVHFGFQQNVIEKHYNIRKPKLLDGGNKILTIYNNRAFILSMITGEILSSFPVGKTDHYSIIKTEKGYKESIDKNLPNVTGPRNINVQHWELVDNRKKILTYGHIANETRLWDIDTQKEIIRFDKVKGDLQSLKVLPDESAIIFCVDGELTKWDMATGLELDKPIAELKTSEFFIFNNSDYMWNCTTVHMPLLTLLNYKTGKIAAHFYNEISFDKVVCTPDGEHIACLNKGELSFLKLENMEW
jgi:WD40 repeat protein